MRRLLNRLRAARIPRPTMRGVGLLAAGIAALAVAYATGRREILYVSMLLFALPVLAATYVLVGRVRFGVTRAFGSEVVEAGRPTSVEVTVQNQSALAAPSVVWRDLLPSGTGATPPGILPPLDGTLFTPDRIGNSARVRYTLTPGRRGIFPIGPMLLDEQDPLRLCSMRHAVGEADALVVTPRVTALPTRGLRHSLSDGASRRVTRRSSAGEDDLITREYQAGDPLRRVHWRATARHGELMVRQEEQRSTPEAMVLLDSDSRHFPGADGPRGSESFERAVECAASVVLHLRETGYGVQLLETVRSTVSYLAVRDASGGEGERDLLVRLAELEPRDGAEHDFLSRAAGELRRSGQSVPLFAVFGTLDAAETESVAVLRHWCEPAIAFLTHDSGATARALTAAGWICVDLDSQPDLVAAWAAASLAESGTHERV